MTEDKDKPKCLTGIACPLQMLEHHLGSTEKLFHALCDTHDVPGNRNFKELLRLIRIDLKACEEHLTKFHANTDKSIFSDKAYGDIEDILGEMLAYTKIMKHAKRKKHDHYGVLNLFFRLIKLASNFNNKLGSSISNTKAINA